MFGERRKRRTHENAGNEEKLAVMIFENRKKTVDEHSSESDTICGTKSFGSYSKWRGIVQVWIDDGEEVEDGVEVHARNKSDAKRESNDALAGKDFFGNHGISCSFPLPDAEGDDEEEADEHCTQDVGACPWMGVAATLERYEAL
jgi:hypothetical protein